MNNYKSSLNWAVRAIAFSVLIFLLSQSFSAQLTINIKVFSPIKIRIQYEQSNHLPNRIF